MLRLYKDRSSHEAILALKAEESGTHFSVKVPGYSTRILALEGHCLNDRFTLCNLLSECVRELGGAFLPGDLQPHSARSNTTERRLT